MKDVDNVIKGKGTTTWNETTRQDYIEYKQGNNTCKIWIENLNSIKENCNHLITTSMTSKHIEV